MELRVPKNLLEFEEMYSTEEQCVEALQLARWPEGFVCPSCTGSNGIWLSRRKVMKCNQCGCQTSATAGTLFHGCKLPLKTLFRLIYLVVGEKDGMNNCALMRQLSINRKTAQLWSRKLRDALLHREQVPLSGTVEVDETTIGGPAPGYLGRSLGKNQSLVVILVENNGGKCGRIRLEPTQSASAKTLKKAIEKNVAKGSTIRTDGWTPYN